MRSWGHFVGLLGPKFWKIYRKEGLVRTLLRAKPYRYSHEKAGWNDVVRLVGTDEWGNRYYEDFDHHSFNTRRWVEFSDYAFWFPTGKKIAPGWHGWMHYMYDDPPKKQNFVEPYWRPYRTDKFWPEHPTKSYKNPGHLLNDDKPLNDKLARERNFAYWEPPSGRERRRGKKILVDRPDFSAL